MVAMADYIKATSMNLQNIFFDAKVFCIPVFGPSDALAKAIEIAGDKPALA
jgi:hypothetical protein